LLSPRRCHLQLLQLQPRIQPTGLLTSPIAQCLRNEVIDQSIRLLLTTISRSSYQKDEIPCNAYGEMEDRLLKEEIAMARLNPSSEDTLNEYLDSIIDGQVLLELP